MNTWPPAKQALMPCWTTNFLKSLNLLDLGPQCISCSSTNIIHKLLYKVTEMGIPSNKILKVHNEKGIMHLERFLITPSGYNVLLKICGHLYLSIITMIYCTVTNLSHALLIDGQVKLKLMFFIVCCLQHVESSQEPQNTETLRSDNDEGAHIEGWWAQTSLAHA